MTIRNSLGEFFFGSYFTEQRATLAHDQSTLAQARLQLAEDSFAVAGAAAGRSDRNDKTWGDRIQDLDDALDAWAINPYARRIVNLYTAHVIGRSLTITTPYDDINTWISNWWNSQRNQLTTEIYAWCDELTRSGETFLRLTTNPHDGSQIVRAVPARWIAEITTDPDDYRHELSYHDEANDQTTAAYEPDSDPLKPAMLHHAINRPVGAVRSWGGDLDAVLPSLERYMNWLRGRVDINTSRGNWAWDMQAANAARVTELTETYRSGIIPPGSLFVHTPDEQLKATSPEINAADARDDGVALRQAIAVGAGVAPFMLGDEFSTRAQAREATLPIMQNFALRQAFFGQILTSLAQASITRAFNTNKWHRYKNANLPTDYKWNISFSDLTREDNTALANAALTIVNAVSTMREQGWIDDTTAIEWATKFAGEPLSFDLIAERLTNPPALAQIIADEEAPGSGSAGARATKRRKIDSSSQTSPATAGAHSADERKAKRPGPAQPGTNWPASNLPNRQAPA